jgi:hypothetical protein
VNSDCNVRRGEGGVKHTMSCLSDLVIRHEIDDERKAVVLSVDAFDSSLIASFIMNVLDREYGVRAWRDDNDKTSAWLTRRSPYSLRIEIAGVGYEAEVVRLFGSDKIAVALSPVR